MNATFLGFLAGAGTTSMLDVGTQSLHCHIGVLLSFYWCFRHVRNWVNSSVCNSNRNQYMTEGSPLRRFKGSKIEFRGLEVDQKNNSVCIHKILETVMIIDDGDDGEPIPTDHGMFGCWWYTVLRKIKMVYELHPCGTHGQNCD